MHNPACVFLFLYGFDGLCIRVFAQKLVSASTLPRLGAKVVSYIVGSTRFPAMTQPLVTAEQLAQLLAVGAARAAGQSIDPLPAVRLFTPDANATWLLAAIDPADGDTAWGLIDLGIGMPALGTVRLSDLAGIVGPLQRPVLRDLYFHAVRPLSEYVMLAERDGSIAD